MNSVWNKASKVKVSNRTLRNILHKNGYHSRNATAKLDLSIWQKQDSLRWDENTGTVLLMIGVKLCLATNKEII